MSKVSGTNVVEKVVNKFQKIVNFELQNKNKFTKNELVVVEEAQEKMSEMFSTNANESAKDFMAQEIELKNQFDRVIQFIVN